MRRDSKSTQHPLLLPACSIVGREAKVPHRLSNNKDRPNGASLCLRLAQSATIEGALEDLAEIAAEKGIHLYSIRVKRGKLESEFKPSNNVVLVGKINEIEASVEGRQTQLVVKFFEPSEGAAVGEFEYATHLAAHRIEILAGVDAHTQRGVAEGEERSAIIGELVGESDVMRGVRRDIEIAAGLDLNVLITGEPGTGKELVAKGIHNASNRAKKPFVDVNVAALNSSLIESELFGHEKGAFTGANTRKIGRFEKADGGTLFLDEIGDLPLESQVKLLRVLQERKLERVGGTESIKIDIRLIAATNKDLRREVEEGRFRRDLYYRLRGYRIRTPALREHLSDVPILIRRYYPSVKFQEGALELLSHYDWQGNVRELRSTVECLKAKANGRMITTDQVRLEIEDEQQFAIAPANTDCFPRLREGETLIDYLGRAALAVYERERALLGSHTAAAHQLGMHRNTLYDWLGWAREHVAK
ncbi:MAG: sigma-54-dependent Fis family transcriptional regulator [Chloracidobacterium sp.]|nr:sigma-54-dependent Fis family transcriptional regulator [Chloracidobacterium sp.]